MFPVDILEVLGGFKNGSVLQIRADEIPELKDLPDAIQRALFIEALKDTLKDEAKNHLKAAKADKRIDKTIDAWLDEKRSENTKEAYRTAIQGFLAHLTDLSVPFVLAKGEHVSPYLKRMATDGASANTIRARVASISFFYRFAQSEDLVERNPCLGVTLPKREYKKAVKPDMQSGGSTIPVMNKAELARILKAVKEDPTVKRSVYDGLVMMSRYGLRVGSVQTIKRIRGNDTAFSIKAKGGTIQRFELNDGEPWPDGFDPSEVTTRKLQYALKKACEDLYGQGEIRSVYTCHDLRHYFAHEHYKKNKDIVALKSALGHAALNITDMYLQQMGVV